MRKWIAWSNFNSKTIPNRLIFPFWGIITNLSPIKIKYHFLNISTWIIEKQISKQFVLSTKSLNTIELRTIKFMLHLKDSLDFLAILEICILIPSIFMKKRKKNYLTMQNDLLIMDMESLGGKNASSKVIDTKLNQFIKVLNENLKNSI